jgi:hypothetical protein
MIGNILFSMTNPKNGSGNHGKPLPGCCKIPVRHCEERFLRRGNPELLDISNGEIASLRSQRRLKVFSTTSANLSASDRR